MRKKENSFLLILLIGCIGFAGQNCTAKKDPLEAPAKIIEFDKVESGTYEGNYASTTTPIKVKVSVTVEKPAILEIKIVEHRTLAGQKAEFIINTMIEKQSMDVDGISGATKSSNAIKNAVADALKKGISK